MGALTYSKHTVKDGALTCAMCGRQSDTIYQVETDTWTLSRMYLCQECFDKEAEAGEAVLLT